MRNRLLFCMCFCSVMLAAQQPGQRFPNRPRIFPRKQGQESQSDQPEMQQGRQPMLKLPVIDTDGDGLNSDQEIHAAIQKQLNQLRGRNQQRFKKVLERFDADKDQQISMAESMEIYKEVKEGIQKLQGGENPRSGVGPQSGDPRGNTPSERQMPSPGSPPNPDLDGDGLVSEQEIYATIQNHLKGEREHNPQQYNMIMQRFDADKDQVLSFEEAMEMHREHEKRMQQGMGSHPGDPSGNDNMQPGERPLSDNGLLKGVKIEGLNISSGH